MTEWRWLRQVILRPRSLLQRDGIERALEEGFQFHVEQRIEMEMSRGLPARCSRRSASRHGRNGEAKGSMPRYAPRELHRRPTARFTVGRPKSAPESGLCRAHRSDPDSAFEASLDPRFPGLARPEFLV